MYAVTITYTDNQIETFLSVVSCSVVGERLTLIREYHTVVVNMHNVANFVVRESVDTRAATIPPVSGATFWAQATEEMPVLQNPTADEKPLFSGL